MICPISRFSLYENPPYSPFAKVGLYCSPLWQRGVRGDFQYFHSFTLPHLPSPVDLAESTNPAEVMPVLHGRRLRLPQDEITITGQRKIEPGQDRLI